MRDIRVDKAIRDELFTFVLDEEDFATVSNGSNKIVRSMESENCWDVIDDFFIKFLEVLAFL